jgi:hypothetical protein
MHNRIRNYAKSAHPAPRHGDGSGLGIVVEDLMVLSTHGVKEYIRRRGELGAFNKYMGHLEKEFHSISKARSNATSEVDKRHYSRLFDLVLHTIGVFTDDYMDAIHREYPLNHEIKDALSRRRKKK